MATEDISSSDAKSYLQDAAKSEIAKNYEMAIANYMKAWKIGNTDALRYIAEIYYYDLKDIKSCRKYAFELLKCGQIYRIEHTYPQDEEYQTHENCLKLIDEANTLFIEIEQLIDSLPAAGNKSIDKYFIESGLHYRYINEVVKKSVLKHDHAFITKLLDKSKNTPNYYCVDYIIGVQLSDKDGYELLLRSAQNGFYRAIHYLMTSDLKPMFIADLKKIN